jgi:hypothetical protein
MKTMQRQTVLKKPERPMHEMQGDLYPWIAKYEDNAWTATQEDQCISILFAVESFTGGCTIPQFAGWLITKGYFK